MTRLICGSVLAAALSSPALSQALPEQEMQTPSIFSPESWNVNLGGGVGIGPAYPGSDHYKVHPITIGSISYKNFLFLGPAGAGASFFDIEGLSAGPILGYRGGRKETNDTRLKGTGRISTSIEGGFFVRYDLGLFELSGTIRQALTHSSNGAIGRVRLDFTQHMLNDALEIHMGPEIDLGDGGYVSRWFGITPGQSAASGLPVYDPDGGITGLGVYVTADYGLTQHIFVHAFGAVRELSGDAGDSPLTVNKTQALAGLGLVYHWTGE